MPSSKRLRNSKSWKTKFSEANPRLFVLSIFSSVYDTVILGCLIYAFVLSLPTIYDYFFYEEEEEEDEDSYEDLSYVEIAIDYVVISVQQVIGGIWQAFDNLFFSTSKCKKCSRGGTIF